MWKEKTNKGRIVYDRPTHHFNLCDAARIVSKLDPYDIIEDKEFVCYYRILQNLLRWALSEPLWTKFGYDTDAKKFIVDVLDLTSRSLKNGKLPVDFSGGEFGGSGATR